MTSSSLDQLVHSFAAALEIAPSEVNDELAYQENPKWDSTAHMMLIAQLEGDFEIMLEMDDILDMSSFVKAKAILKKYRSDLVL